MQSPPPYYSSAPKKSNLGWIIAAVVGLLAVCCIAPLAGVGFFAKNMVGKVGGFFVCGWTLSQMRDGVREYAKAHNGTLPPAATWQDDIAKYLKPISSRGAAFTLPPMNSTICDAESNTGFMYNSELAGKKLSDIKEPDSTIVLWEVSSQGRNQHSAFRKPAASSGPALMGKIPRGWVQQPVLGQPFWEDQNGTQQTIPSPGHRRSNGFSIDVKDENGKTTVDTGDKSGAKGGGGD